MWLVRVRVRSGALWWILDLLLLPWQDLTRNKKERFSGARRGRARTKRPSHPSGRRGRCRKQTPEDDFIHGKTLRLNKKQLMFTGLGPLISILKRKVMFSNSSSHPSHSLINLHITRRRLNRRRDIQKLLNCIPHLRRILHGTEVAAVLQNRQRTSLDEPVQSGCHVQVDGLVFVSTSNANLAAGDAAELLVGELRVVLF